MPVLLVFGEDSEIPLPIEESVREAWELQLGRATNAGSIGELRVRLALCFGRSLEECLDIDLKPPTEAQVRYATVITRELGLSLNSDVLRYRGAMTEFITRYSDAFKSRRQRASELD